MATHKLTLRFDDATGSLAVDHRCTVAVGAHTVSLEEDVVLDDAAGVAASLRALIDGNRSEMEARATRGAIQHAAAVDNALGPNVKQVKLGGTIGAIGAGKATK